MRFYDYDAKNRSKHQKVNAEARKKHVLLNIVRHFKSLENSSSNQVFLDENSL